MVDNYIEGVYANVTKINPETLSSHARIYLKAIKEQIKESRSIDKNIGNLIVKTMIKYHNDTGESLTALITELTTVSFFVIEKHRRFYIKTAQYLLLGTIFAILTVSEDKQEIIDIIEQTILAILTNPIFEFSGLERINLARLTLVIEGYLRMLNRFTHRFTTSLPLLVESLRTGMVQALEICNATQEEIETVRNKRYSKLNIYWGELKFIFNFAWPMFDVNFKTFVKWFNHKTGIELWPEK